MKITVLMKKYVSVWVVMFALFNVIAFVSVGWNGYEKYTWSFWTGYIFITVAFLGQLVCAYVALRKDDVKKLFYNIPLITISYTGLILSFVFGGLCMLLSALPYWAGILLCAIMLALNAVAVIKASAAADIVQQIDEKIESETQFIRTLAIDADLLCGRVKSEVAKKECRRVWEAIRYSDPMSSPELGEIESEITEKFAELSRAVSQGNQAQITALSEELIVLVDQRNKKCKILK